MQHFMPLMGGAAAPDKNEGPAPLQRTRPSNNNFTTAHSLVAALEEQQFQTLVRRAAAVRCCLYPLADGYLMTRQAVGMSRELPDLRAVACVLRLLEAQ